MSLECQFRIAMRGRFDEFYDAGNYPAALVEAQKYEVAAKARFGPNHLHYGYALGNLALVYWRLVVLRHNLRRAFLRNRFAQ